MPARQSKRYLLRAGPTRLPLAEVSVLLVHVILCMEPRQGEAPGRELKSKPNGSPERCRHAFWRDRGTPPGLKMHHCRPDADLVGCDHWPQGLRYKGVGLRRGVWTECCANGHLCEESRLGLSPTLQSSCMGQNLQSPAIRSDENVPFYADNGQEIEATIFYFVTSNRCRFMTGMFSRVAFENPLL